MSYAAWNKKLARCRELPKWQVWWAREPFHDEKYKDTAPKWHVFADRQVVEQNMRYQWVARCGYKRTFWEGLWQVPRLHTAKTPPKKADRCVKCLDRLLK